MAAHFIFFLVSISNSTERTIGSALSFEDLNSELILRLIDIMIKPISTTVISMNG